MRWMYLAPQNIPCAISVLTLGSKVVLIWPNDLNKTSFSLSAVAVMCSLKAWGPKMPQFHHLGSATTHWHRQERQGYISIAVRCIIMWGKPSAMIGSLHKSTLLPEVGIDPLKMVCGCPCDRVIIKNVLNQLCMQSFHPMKSICWCTVAYRYIYYASTWPPECSGGLRCNSSSSSHQDSCYTGCPTSCNWFIKLRHNTNLSSQWCSFLLCFQWWLCFAKRKFMDKSLSAPGY